MRERERREAWSVPSTHCCTAMKSWRRRDDFPEQSQVLTPLAPTATHPQAFAQPCTVGCSVPESRLLDVDSAETTPAVAGNNTNFSSAWRNPEQAPWSHVMAGRGSSPPQQPREKAFLEPLSCGGLRAISRGKCFIQSLV